MDLEETPAIESCATCKFMRPRYLEKGERLKNHRGDGPFFFCLRYPPVYDSSFNHGTEFPEVDLTTWCGEYVFQAPAALPDIAIDPDLTPQGIAELMDIRRQPTKKD